MLLKFKAKIYQYTGIFLAQNELLDYINSRERLEDLAASVQEYLDMGNTLEYSIYMAHEMNVALAFYAHHNFHRVMPGDGIKGWFITFYEQLKWDLRG